MTMNDLFAPYAPYAPSRTCVPWSMTDDRKLTNEFPMSTLYPPYVIERSSRGERTYDIFSRLLMDRIVFLGTPVNDDVANIIIAQLLFLDADNPERDIHLYVNSPGGSVSAGLAIYDTMQFLRAPVNTTCMGMAASMGCFLLAGGRKGRRAALPHARVMMHQPSGGTQGTASDIQIQAKEILYLRGKMHDLMSKHTGRPVEQIERDFDRDYYMSAEEAKAYGIIDKVVSQDTVASIRTNEPVELTKS
jgi:ATP-dependent Clp protease protease subunit